MTAGMGVHVDTSARLSS